MNRNIKTHTKKLTAPMDAALRFLAPRARTVREVERYLDLQHYGEYEIQQVIDRLEELGYLNDAAYASEFIRTRLNTKPISRRKLEMQLHQHEIAPDVIEEALYAVTDAMELEHAICIAKKYAAMMQSLPEPERNDRLMRRLLSRGFSPDCSREAIQTVMMQKEL